MGNEIAQSAEWNHDSSVNWHLLEFDKHKGIQSLYRDLNHLYKDQLALHEQDCSQDGFEWIDHHNSDQSILSFVRKSKSGDEKVYVISNFTPIPRENFRLGVLDEGEYNLLLSSDDKTYWGSDFECVDSMQSDEQPYNDRPQSIALNLPPLATLYIAYKAS